MANQGACPASNGGAGDRAIETGTGSWRRIGNVGTSPVVLPRILAWNMLGDLCASPAVAGLVAACLSGPCFDGTVLTTLDDGLVIIGLALRLAADA